MTRPDPALVRECMTENRPRLLATIELVKQALTNRKDIDDDRNSRR